MTQEAPEITTELNRAIEELEKELKKERSLLERTSPTKTFRSLEEIIHHRGKCSGLMNAIETLKKQREN